MAEARRIAVTTVGSLKKDKKWKETAPTHRFNLALVEPNDKTCPEFNYNDLLKSSRGENNSVHEVGDDDQEDDKLRALAKKFEAKYGPRQGKKHKQKFGRIEDYIDLGMGYDENDPFIDNTDAYDELVPSTLTTQHGGFYINSGKLNFKEVDNSDEANSDSSEFEGILDAASKKKRRRLKELDKDGRRRKRRENDIPKRKRSHDNTDSALMKQKKLVKQPTVATLLQQHKAQQQIQQQSLQATMTSAALMATSTGQPVSGNILSNPDGKLVNSTIVDTIESVINASRDHNSITDGGVNTGTGTGSSDSEIATSMAVEPEEEPKLPDGLPSDLDSLVRLIKETAEKSEEGKCKFFSNDVNNILLSIEMKTRDLVCSQRSMVYAHLASHLPCTKETLLKRVKKLRLEQEDGKLKEPMNRLREAVAAAMPEVIEKHANKCQQLAANCKDGVNNVLSDTESDDSSDTSNISEKDAQEKNSNSPRRKFEWNDNLRFLLMDVVRIKMKCFEVSKIRSQSAEEYLKHFLDYEVKQLWPAGWIRSRALYKASKEAHSYLTNKPKKPLALTTKKVSINSTVGSGDQPVPKSATFFPNGLGTTVLSALPSVSTLSTNWPTTKSSTVKNQAEVKAEMTITVAPTPALTSTTILTSSVSVSTVSANTTVCSAPVMTTSATSNLLASVSSKLSSDANVVTASSASANVKSTATTSANKHDGSHHESKNDTGFQRTKNSVDSITVSSLLKQSNPLITPGSAMSAQQHSLESLVGGLKFRTMDYSESLQAAAVLSNPSPNDVLHHIIHASLADFPSSGNSKMASVNTGSALAASIGSFSETTTTTSTSVVNQPVVVSGGYSPVKHVTAVSSPSHVGQLEIKSVSATVRPQQVSLLKNPPSSSKGDAHVSSRTVDNTGYLKNAGDHGTNRVASTASKVVSSEQTSQNHKMASSFSAVNERNSTSKASGFTTPFQSAFEFTEAIERTLQGKNSPSSVNYGLYGLQQNYRKEANDLVMSSLYSNFARKETNDLSHLSPSTQQQQQQQQQHPRKEHEQPLNFSQGRHVNVPSNSAFNSRVSPVSASNYASPGKEGSKQQHCGLNSSKSVSSLPSFSSTLTGSVRQVPAADSLYLGSDVLSLAVASALYGSESHATYSSNSSVQTTASGQTRVGSLVASPSANHTSPYGSTGSNSKLISHYPGMDYTTTLSQVLNPSWRSPPANPTPQSAYNRHYVKMLPHVVSTQTNYPASSTLKMSDATKAGSLLPHHGSSSTSRNPSASSYDQGSSF